MMKSGRTDRFFLLEPEPFVRPKGNATEIKVIDRKRVLNIERIAEMWVLIAVF